MVKSFPFFDIKKNQDINENFETWFPPNEYYTQDCKVTKLWV